MSTPPRWAWRWLALLALPAAASSAWARDAQSVIACMRDNLPQRLQVEHLALRSTDASGGVRRLQGVLYVQREGGLLRSMMALSQPAALAGAAYLLRERADDDDEMYMYLPALNRVRRISGAAMNGPLFGTDISYADLRQLQSAYRDQSAVLEPSTTLQNRPVDVLRLNEAAGGAARYTTIRLWVDRASCVALRATFADAQGVVKTLEVPASHLQQFGKHWLATELTLRDVRRNSQTRLEITGVDHPPDIPRRVFDPHTYYLGNGP